MSGSLFSSKGAAGAVANTVWFGKVPDRLSVMGQGSFNSATGINATSGSPANLVSLWTPYNTNMLGGSNVVTSSFGASASAPDGTTNGIKLVESATNTVHACESTFITRSVGPYTIRVSVFAKAGERTRFALYLGNGSLDQNNGGVTGCKTIFDLAGGQIGVANTAFGSGYTAGPTEIVNFGSGWYRCTMDVSVGSLNFSLNYTGFIFGILLDNGSGTGADATSYSGNGTNGVFFWKSTALPPQAWALNTVTFFDDFTSLSTVDTGNTLAPGFNWYIKNTWPNFPSHMPSNGAKFTISSPSILKIAAGANSISDIGMETASSNGNTTPASPLSGTYVGRVFQSPMLIETSMAVTQGPHTDSNSPTMWTPSLEALVGNPQINTAELDFFEFYTTTTHEYPGLSLFSGNVLQATLDAANGYPIWYANVTYDDGFTGGVNAAADGQQLYQTLIANNLNNVPHLTVGVDWSAFSLAGNNIPYANQFYIDWNQQHVLSTLWLSSRGNDSGHVLTFFDGRYCGPGNDGIVGNITGHVNYSITSQFGIADSLHYPILWGVGQVLDQFIDWVKVTQ